MTDEQITRFVLVDHRKGGEGRVMDVWCKATVSMQDDNRTLKVFLDDTKVQKELKSIGT